MLLHTGKDAREVYKSITWTEDGDKDKVLEALEHFCLPQKNILYERHGFCSLYQEEGEAIDSKKLIIVNMTTQICQQQ